MRAIAALVSALVLLASPANAQVLSWQGVGPVRLGMTVKEAERALASSFQPRGRAFGKECWWTRRADGQDEEIFYEIHNDKIVIISVVPDIEKQATSNVRDAHGIGVGDTEADLRNAYGELKKRYAYHFSEESQIEAAKVRERLGIKLREPLPSPDYWIKVESPDHERAMIFTTRDSKIIRFSTGFKPTVTEDEQCG